MDEDETVMLTARMPKIWVEWIDELAAKQSSTRSNLVRNAIREYVTRRNKMFERIISETERKIEATK